MDPRQALITALRAEQRELLARLDLLRATDLPAWDEVLGRLREIDNILAGLEPAGPSPYTLASSVN